jgi:4-amino-4-deoxy-L-arabinose transferase-like glycosyltransferase
MSIRTWFSDRIHQQALLLLISGLALRLVIAQWLPPGFDESYYYLYTLHPDWSYFDHPPLVGLLTALGPWLTGSVSGFSIRVGSVLLYTGSLLFLYLTGCHLFNRQAGLLTLWIASVIPIFQVAFGVLTLPDSPLIFFWSTTLYCAAIEFFPRSEQEGIPYYPTPRLALISLLVGLACLGKYHGLALGFGLVLFCLLSSVHRSALWSGWTILGIELFLIALSPVFIWNAQQDWISFRFQSGRALESQPYQLLRLLETIGTGIAFLWPTLGIPLWWVSIKQVTIGFIRFIQGLAPRSFDLKSGFILWVSLPVIVIFTFMGGYRQILPTWPMPGFWGLTLLLGAYSAIWQQKNSRWIPIWLSGSGVLVTGVILLSLSHVSFGLLQKPNQYFEGWIPIEKDASTQLISIEQLRENFISQPILREALAETDFIFTNHYFLGGQIAMALSPISSAPVTAFTSDPRGFAFWSDPEDWIGKDALYITSKYFEKSQDVEDSSEYENYFQSVKKLLDIPLLRSGEVVQTFLVYQAQNLQKPFPWPYGS